MEPVIIIDASPRKYLGCVGTNSVAFCQVVSFISLSECNSKAGRLGGCWSLSLYIACP
ncbi:hypothetical protein BGZ63DRAFT_395114 [Mariannaea sp. PMI_226]|nr:hypothetical protein BGZ63DRAFT_395114 [Mariannaea sp. PMI_226]